jgi:hypothetical protein
LLSVGARLGTSKWAFAFLSSRADPLYHGGQVRVVAGLLAGIAADAARGESALLFFRV